ncbi:MAG: hypothetical protein U0R26_09125 [Solirubrobacterales bacterium]
MGVVELETLLRRRGRDAGPRRSQEAADRDGGFKVDLIEVESVIDSHPAVAESVVVGVDTDRPASSG